MVAAATALKSRSLAMTCECRDAKALQEKLAKKAAAAAGADKKDGKK